MYCCRPLQPILTAGDGIFAYLEHAFVVPASGGCSSGFDVVEGAVVAVAVVAAAVVVVAVVVVVAAAAGEIAVNSAGVDVAADALFLK